MLCAYPATCYATTVSYRADALQWLESLPTYTWFWSREVPAPPSTVNGVMSRLAKDPDSAFLRVAPGFYFKDEAPKHEIWKAHPTGALIYGGQGTGLHGFDAMHNLDWCSQMAAKVDVVTLRRVKPFASYIRYTSRPNRRRARLNWTEVTLLEGISHLKFTERSWPECLEALGSGVSESRMPWKPWQPFVLRRELLLWAAETERHPDPVNFLYRINEACEAAPCQAVAA